MNNAFLIYEILNNYKLLGNSMRRRFLWDVNDVISVLLAFSGYDFKREEGIPYFEDSLNILIKTMKEKEESKCPLPFVCL